MWKQHDKRTVEEKWRHTVSREKKGMEGLKRRDNVVLLEARHSQFAVEYCEGQVSCTESQSTQFSRVILAVTK